VVADGVRDYIRREIRAVKDTKKVFDKTSSELDSALQKNSHASKSKPQDGEEASKVLADTVVAFRHTAVDYGYQVNVFHLRKGHHLLHTMLSFMEAQSTFFRHGHDVMKDSQTFMKTVGDQV
jgi:Arf-GAP/coiled-coil/ANK repeat/PH domain-containing protein